MLRPAAERNAVRKLRGYDSRPTSGDLTGALRVSQDRRKTLRLGGIAPDQPQRGYLSPQPLDLDETGTIAGNGHRLCAARQEGLDHRTPQTLAAAVTRTAGRTIPSRIGATP